jgi:hypothetical protein
LQQQLAALRGDGSPPLSEPFLTTTEFLRERFNRKVMGLGKLVWALEEESDGPDSPKGAPLGAPISFPVAPSVSTQVNLPSQRSASQSISPQGVLSRMSRLSISVPTMSNEERIAQLALLSLSNMPPRSPNTAEVRGRSLLLSASPDASKITPAPRLLGKRYPEDLVPSCAPKRQKSRPVTSARRLFIPFFALGNQALRDLATRKSEYLQIAPKESVRVLDLRRINKSPLMTPVYQGMVQGKGFCVIKGNGLVEAPENDGYLLPTLHKLSLYKTSMNLLWLREHIAPHYHFDCVQDCDSKFIDNNLTCVELIKWIEGKFPEKLNREDPIWQQLRGLFMKCTQNRIGHDLRRENLGVEGGKVMILSMSSADLGPDFFERQCVATFTDNPADQQWLLGRDESSF